MAGCTHTHYRIGSAPVDFYRTIVFGQSTTGKYHVMHIPGNFIGFFGLKNPIVAHADDFGGIVQIVQSHPQAINAAIRRRIWLRRHCEQLLLHRARHFL